MVWTQFGITIELLNPNDLIVGTFSAGAIETFRILSACLSAILLVGTISYGVYYSCFTTKTYDDNVVNESSLLAA